MPEFLHRFGSVQLIDVGGDKLALNQIGGGTLP
jgi:hypothetical protein